MLGLAPAVVMEVASLQKRLESRLQKARRRVASARASGQAKYEAAREVDRIEACLRSLPPPQVHARADEEEEEEPDRPPRVA